jgi:hypothetical protein
MYKLQNMKNDEHWLPNQNLLYFANLKLKNISKIW